MTAVFLCQTPARDAVAAAARLLDQLDAAARYHGLAIQGLAIQDWNTVVDPTSLNLDSDSRCVLGQRYGHFDMAPLFHDLAEPADVILRAKVLGFWATAAPGEEDDYEHPGNRDELTQRWREEIYDRNRVPSPAWVLAA